MKYYVCSFIFLFLINCFVQAQNNKANIRLNQVGFYPSAHKIAVVVNDTVTTDFYMVSTNKSDTVFHGKLGDVHHSNNSSLVTRIADFSNFTKPGKYKIISGKDASFSFSITKNVLHDVAVASLKGFYYQRASMPLNEKFAGKWARAEGHPDTMVYVHSSASSANKPEGTVIATPGGWYDAGDYNKYIVNSGISTATLLSAYEDFPGYFDTLKTNIPESNDAVPDVLNEALYNIRWMFTMQDTNDGGVYHKCTNAKFDAMIMPDKATAKRYVVEKSTAATLDFAAVTAQASRIFSNYTKQLPGLADSCKKAAAKAWQWAIKNPAIFYNQNEMNKHFQPAIITGDYGDNNVDDEFFWAACELYVTTKDEGYFNAINKQIDSPFSLPSWSNVTALGFYTLIRKNNALPAKHTAVISTLKNKIVDVADSYLQHLNNSAFATVMGENRNDFNWGSNGNAANQSIVLINAYLITKNKKYVDAALTNLDYILGRNATGYCFVTGIGTNCTMHPHHRVSVSDSIEEPVPGLMAGGPNPGRQDGCNYTFFEPETAYLDSDCAYASNEIAINWNAPLVYIANALEALQTEKNKNK